MTRWISIGNDIWLQELEYFDIGRIPVPQSRCDETWIFEFPPHGVFRAHYPKGIDVAHFRYILICGHFRGCSESPWTNLITAILEHYKIPFGFGRNWFLEKFEYSYLYSLNVNIKYKFHDILNFDVTQYSEEAKEYLKQSILNENLLNRCINHKIFLRPLTELERLECAKKYLDEYNNHLSAIARNKINYKKTFR